MVKVQAAKRLNLTSPTALQKQKQVDVLETQLKNTVSEGDKKIIRTRLRKLKSEVKFYEDQYNKGS